MQWKHIKGSWPAGLKLISWPEGSWPLAIDTIDFKKYDSFEPWVEEYKRGHPSRWWELKPIEEIESMLLDLPLSPESYQEHVPNSMFAILSTPQHPVE